MILMVIMILIAIRRWTINDTTIAKLSMLQGIIFLEICAKVINAFAAKIYIIAGEKH